jgi:hypothetical protein
MSTRSEILEGMASLLWASAWADHADDHRCTNLSGKEITSIMPPVPALAKQIAARWAIEIARRNSGSTVVDLWERAVIADKQENKRQGTPNEFGGDLAMECMGSGVSWFDDHAEFPIKLPEFSAGTETADLQFYAGEHCKKNGDPRCSNCDGYNPSSKTKCSNCGEAL